ncbi:MAG: FtsX-like permease family protein [Acidimicrobiia bacterium]
MRILTRKLRRDLRRQSWQFAAVAVTIVLGITLFAASFDAFRNLSRSYHRTYERLAFADLTVSGGDDGQFSVAAAGTDGVAAVAGRRQADLPVRVTDDERFYGRIVGMPVDNQPAVDQVQVTSGEYLSSDEPTGVLVEQHMADHFDLTPGDTLDVLLGEGYTTVTVVGTVISAEYLWPARSRQQLFTTPDDFGVLFVPESLVRQAPAEAQVTQTLVLYDDDTDSTSLDDELAKVAADAEATDIQTQAEQPSNAALSEDLQGFEQLSFMFPVLFLTAAGLATLILLNRIVRAQRPQIGTLMANGLGATTIRRHFLAYGLLVGTAGAIIGGVLGLLLGRLITGAYTSALSIPDTVVGFYPLTLAVGIIFGVGMGAVAAFVPARTASRIRPAEAMNPHPTATRTGPSLVERLLPPVRRLPIRWRMSLRGIGRNRRRAASIVIGVVLSLTLILASWGMLDTTQILVNEQFNEIQHDDAQAFFTVPVDDSVTSAVSATEGVEDAERVVALNASIAHGDEQYATQLQAFQHDTAMHTFTTSSGTIPLPDEGVLAGSAVRSLIGADVGDDVTISFSSPETTITTTIAGFVDEPLGTLLYMDQGQLVEALAAADPSVSSDALTSPAVASVMAIYDDGADADAVQSHLLDLDSVAAVVSTRSLLDAVNGALALFYVFVGIMLVFGASMAFALLFNMISVNIAERSVELATMRANGLAVREVNRLMTGETLLLTLIGIPLGLVVGYGVSAAFMASYSSDLFDFSLQMRSTSLFFAAVAIVVTALVAQWPALRAVRRIDIAAIVRERAV